MAKTNKDLINYLENIIELEQTAYTQREMINCIDEDISRLGHTGWIDKRSVQSTSFGDLICTWVFICGGIGIILGALIGLFSGDNIFEAAWNLISEGISYGIYGSVVGIVVAIIAYIVLKCSENRKKEDAEQEYLNEKALDHKRVLREKEQAQRLELMKQAVSHQQGKTDALLQKYYNTNILYDSYQNFAAVCSICEYLKSGKCSQLQGHEGAYVLYDNERRLDRVIERLDDIVLRLDQIKGTQFMLYSAIQEGNKTLNRVLDEAYKQTELQEFSANQNAITAYNSGIIAREASMGNWLKVYELHKKGM